MFDLTTIAQWRGPAVGIVRVERELARRARRYLGKDVAFCLYDRSHAAILLVDDVVVDDILRGRIRLDFSESPVTQVFENPIRKKIRVAMLQNATVYRLFQRIRGRSFTRAEIWQIQAAERAKRNEPELVPLAKLPHHPARLDADTTYISGGLDWQYKDLRALWTLQQTYGFSYCAIVYDLIAIRFPQFVTVPGYVELLTDYFGELIWLADRAMCVSQTTRQDWLSHAHEVGAPPVPAGVFPLGCDLSPRAKYSRFYLPPALKGKQFAVYVSTIEPRKNHYMLYQAWEECIRTKQIDPERHRLVFVGRSGWATGDLLHEIKTNPLTRGTIIILHDVSDEQLASLYQRCSFVLLPSMYEGFGLPLTEALGYGKPCVSSNAGALSEFGGDLVMRLDPKDTLAWSRTIGRLMSSSSELKAWEARIRKTYRPITWDDAANCFFNAVLKPVHGGHHSFKRLSSAIGQPAEMNKRATDYLIAGLSQVEGWLCPTTAHIIITLAEEQTRLGIRGDLAEIGVHHGKSFLALATSIAPGETIFAIDVFEDQHRNVDQSGRGDRQIFLNSVNAYAPGTALEIIQESSLDLPAIGWPQSHANSIRFFSIDGSHTREATLNDLRIAEQTTKDGAIVAVDDVLSSHWLGVISGMFDYLSTGGELIPFAIIPNKMLLARGRRMKETWLNLIRTNYGRLVSKRDVKFLDYEVDVVEENFSILKELEAEIS